MPSASDQWESDAYFTLYGALVMAEPSAQCQARHQMQIRRVVRRSHGLGRGPRPQGGQEPGDFRGSVATQRNHTKQCGTRYVQNIVIATCDL